MHLLGRRGLVELSGLLREPRDLQIRDCGDFQIRRSQYRIERERFLLCVVSVADSARSCCHQGIVLVCFQPPAWTCVDIYRGVCSMHSQVSGLTSSKRRSGRFLHYLPGECFGFAPPALQRLFRRQPKQKALSKLAVDFERYAAKRTETTRSKCSISGVERLKPSLTIPSSTICCDGAKQKTGSFVRFITLGLGRRETLLAKSQFRSLSLRIDSLSTRGLAAKAHT